MATENAILLNQQAITVRSSVCFVTVMCHAVCSSLQGPDIKVSLRILFVNNTTAYQPEYDASVAMESVHSVVSTGDKFHSYNSVVNILSSVQTSGGEPVFT